MLMEVLVCWHFLFLELKIHWGEVPYVSCCLSHVLFSHAFTFPTPPCLKTFRAILSFQFSVFPFSYVQLENAYNKASNFKAHKSEGLFPLGAMPSSSFATDGIGKPVLSCVWPRRAPFIPSTSARHGAGQSWEWEAVHQWPLSGCFIKISAIQKRKSLQQIQRVSMADCQHLDIRRPFGCVW